MATSVAASASMNLALGSVSTRSRPPRRRRRGAASLVPGGTRDDDEAHRHRRWRVAPDVDGAASPGADPSIDRPRPNAPSDALERLLATRFATLGDAIRAPPDDRAAIERCVDSLERANPTRAPATSPAQTGDWTLRYTTSVGTMASVATWETVAGAVTDVSQRVDADAERPAVVDVRNVVVVELRSRSDLTRSSPLPLPLPPLTLLGVSDDDALTLRITQRFECRTLGGGRLSAKLLVSDVELVLTAVGGVGESRGRSLGSFRQPGVELQPAKTQLVTYLDDRWRIVRDDASVSVYRRL
jgi:hypothetical protein